MAFIIEQRVGKYVYLYECVSYRNENGEPRSRRVPVGKVDPITGERHFKMEYIARMASSGNPTPVSPTVKFGLEDIHRSSIRDYGAFYLFKQLAEQMGLLGVLEESLPTCWAEVFNLAAYLISTGDPFSYCEDWLASTEAFPVGTMTSQRISELLKGITASDRDKFYRSWCALRSESEYLALDITSTSSYSELIDSVEWGYNRDKEKLPQINICLLMGYQSRYPIYQTVYNGSLKDVTTLQTTMSVFQTLAGEKPMIAVMDKGFYSVKNINAMLSAQTPVDFVIAMPFTGKFARNLVNDERKTIDTLRNTIVCGKESLRAVTRVHSWNGKHKVYAHIYYNVRKAQEIREELFKHVAMLRENAANHPEKHLEDSDYTKYLNIHREDNGEFVIHPKEDFVESELETAGWLVIISNTASNAKDVIKIYREKDIVEKGFQRLKNSLDLGRLRVHSEACMQNKVFIGFISLILRSGIHNVMMDQKLYGKMTMKKLILTLSKLRLQTVNGVRILFPLTKEQRLIFDAFHVEYPV
jgi:transposase